MVSLRPNIIRLSKEHTTLQHGFGFFFGFMGSLCCFAKKFDAGAKVHCSGKSKIAVIRLRQALQVAQANPR